MITSTMTTTGKPVLSANGLTTANGFFIDSYGIGSSPYDVNTPLSFLDDEQMEDFYLNNIDDNHPSKGQVIKVVMDNRKAIKLKEQEIEALRASNLMVIQQTGVHPGLIEKKNKIKLKLGKK